MIRLIVIVLSLVVVAAGAKVAFDNRKLHDTVQQLRTEQEAIYASANRPILIHGLLSPISEYCDLLDSYERPTDTANRVLSLVYRSHCAACERQLSDWEQLLRTVPSQGVSVWLVSIDQEADPISKRLLVSINERHLPFRLYRARGLSFWLHTGVEVTPTTIVLDVNGKDSLVSSVIPGLATKDVIALIRDELFTLTKKTGAQVFPRGFSTAATFVPQS